MTQKKKAVLSERRNSVRASRELSIRHRLAGLSDKRPASWRFSNTKDMSLEGLLFVSDVPYKAGDTVELSVVMAGAIDIVAGLARVIRTMPKKDATYEIAVSLLPKKSKKRPAKKHI